jgi:CheY-like chemotaxis protein
MPAASPFLEGIKIVIADDLPDLADFSCWEILGASAANGGLVPVIAMTAYRLKYDVVIGAGFQEYLMKLFTLDQLAASIDSVS